jgi:electron transfer flavoprotein alpha subunit
VVVVTQNILVIAETWRGELTDGTFEALALGRELADGLGGSLETVLVGTGVAPLADQLSVADTVLVADAPEPIEADTAAICDVLTPLISNRAPAGVLIPLGNVSWDVAGLLPARLGIAFLNGCRSVEVVDGGMVATCVLYGGKMEARVTAAEPPALFGLLPGARPADAGRGEGPATLEEVSVTAQVSGPVRFREYLEPEPGDVDLTQQEVLVAVGRGIESEANMEVAEELAEVLGGAVCGSRPVIDQGWLPLARQVGKSGVTVKPRFYVAAGVSGAPEHVEGMKDAELIFAVNTDPDAPIFNVAHYGMVGDATDILEALAVEVERRKG